MTENKQPIFKATHGRVSAAVWSNEGKDGVFHTVSFERSFKDGEEYKTSNSYGLDSDVSNLERCLFDVKVWRTTQTPRK